MDKNPHIYIPESLQENEEVVEFEEEFIKNESKLLEEQQRLLDLEMAMTTILGGGM